MRKICSEGRQLSQMDKDLVKSLEKVRQKLIEEEASRECPPDPVHGGFVHTISYRPLIVHMWIEDQIRLWHHRCGDDISYFDATGTIVANHNGKRVLYYGLVVRHPNEGDPSVPVAEMITNDHSSGNIRTFIERFRRDESRIYNGRLTSPRQVNIDYSRAILLAVLKEFNNETLETFFQRANRILNKKGTKSDFELTVPHVGCSHFIHIVHRKIKELSRKERSTRTDERKQTEVIDDVWYRFNMYCMSLLVNARTLHELDTIFEDVVVCLSSKKQTKNLTTAYRRLTGRIHNMENDCNINLADFQKEMEDVEIDADECNAENWAKSCNPFVEYFEKKITALRTSVSKDMAQASITENDNRSYCPQFLIFIQKWIPEMPLWSGVLLGRLERYQTGSSEDGKRKALAANQFLSFSSANAKSEGYIEGAMRNLKQEDFPCRKHLRADTFVHENYSRIRRRLRDYADRLHGRAFLKKKRKYKKKTEDNEKNLNSVTESNSSSEENYHNAEEKWGKKDPETPKHNTRLGQFQQSPTIPLSTNPDLKKRKAKRKVHMSFSKIQNKTSSKGLNVCTSKKQKPSKISTDIRNDSQPNGENARSGANVRKNPANRKRKREPKLTPTEKTEKRKEWTEWIYKHDSDKEGKSCSDPMINSKRKKLEEFEETINNCEKNTENYMNFVGLRKKNDCWLNSLIQCIYSLPLKSCLLDDVKKTTKCKVTSALINVISNMVYPKSASFYPSDLHQAIQEQYSLVPGEQQDIHESFTLLCSSGAESMNDIIAGHFQIGCQTTRTCKQCYRHEYQSPETLTTIILPVLNGIHDLESSIARNMDDHVFIYCNVCGEDTEHIRSGKYLYLPETLVLGFNRFKHKSGSGRKTHSKVELPLEIKVMGDMLYHFNLRACALHHGQSIHNGHYTALIFDDGKVIQLMTMWSVI